MDSASLMTSIALVYATLWGAAWGSFLNVVIWRLPRGENLAHPPSRCPGCGNGIAWYDNIPILSWLLLRGRCRHCRTSISARYPLVELIGAGLGAGLWLVVSHGRIGTEPLQVIAMVFLFAFFFAMILVAIAFIDLDLTIIPHALTFPAMAWGLLAALLRPKTGAWVDFFPPVDIVDAAIGCVGGAAVIYLVFAAHRLATGRIGLGGGDATMLAAIGANLGWQSILFVLMFASFQGLLAAVGLYAWERATGRTTQDAPGGLLRGAHKPEFWEGDRRAERGAEEARVEATEAPADPDASAPSTIPEPTGEAATGETGADEGFLRLALPFGPFLALAALEYLFIGRQVMSWLTAGVWP
jgi:leader peptidase (prepilin peptidase)/N-methyltransferase